MRRVMSGVLFLSILFGSLALFAPPALAEETACRGSIGARTVDNLRVPSGASCTLNGTRVQGTINVESRATLTARNVRVIGNVQAENHRSVSLVDSAVGGSVQFDKGGAFSVQRNQIEGGIQVKENSGSSRLARNDVNQDVQVFNHDYGIAISNNTIDGNLQCKENSPAPTGGGNVVQGNKEDQCRNL